MQRELDRPAEVANARGVTAEEVFAHPEKYGMAGEMMTPHNNAAEVNECRHRPVLTKNGGDVTFFSQNAATPHDEVDLSRWCRRKPQP